VAVAENGSSPVQFAPGNPGKPAPTAAYFFLNKSRGFNFGAVFVEGWLVVAAF
jgi:hypothetical protein